jgi:hypothetical protein
MLGLFADEPGEAENHYVGRFGNLASYPKIIMQHNKQKRPSFMFDIRSRPGFSGSPVFIYRSIASDLSNLVTLPPHVPRPGQNVSAYLKLLGVHCGQYPELIDFKVVRKEPKAQPLEVREGDKLRVASSMTVVAPAWEIASLINLKKFRDQREEREWGASHSEEFLKKSVPEVVEEEPEDANLR